jgi:transposase|tara:strand:- start:4009 stop:4386 length:378 start_codon:yes stop_codon:yes gene_type:complete
MALNEQKAQAIRLLSSGVSIPEAAKRVGVGRETVWRWTKEQEFSAELTLYKSQVAVGAQVALNHAVYEAVEALREVIKDKDSTHKSRIDAAKVILDRSKLELQNTKVKVKGNSEDLKAWLDASDD